MIVLRYTQHVVEQFQQNEGIACTEIFSPIVKLNTIKLILGIVVIVEHRRSL